MPAHPTDATMAFRYVDHLSDRIKASTSLKKGEKRKIRLLLAAAEILEEGAYNNMRVADVVERAGVARGTFYIYFKDKSDVALQVLSDFRETMFDLSRIDLAEKDWQDRIYLTNLYYAEMHQVNAGLLRAFYQFVDEADEFRKMRQLNARDWVERLYQAHTRVFGPVPSEEDGNALRRRLHALRVMTDGLCIQVYVEAVPYMIELYSTPQELARAATEIWIDVVTNSEKNAARCSLTDVSTYRTGSGG